MKVLGTILNMPKNTSRLGKNGMKITTISALIYKSKLALWCILESSFLLPAMLLVYIGKKG